MVKLLLSDKHVTRACVTGACGPVLPAMGPLTRLGILGLLWVHSPQDLRPSWASSVTFACESGSCASNFLEAFSPGKGAFGEVKRLSKESRHCWVALVDHGQAIRPGSPIRSLSHAGCAAKAQTA